MTDNTPSLFDQAAQGAAEGRTQRDMAVTRGFRNANSEWRIHARLTILRVAATQTEFTSDDIWGELVKAGYETHDRRALGGILLGLTKQGMVHKTGQYVQTSRPEAHARPIPVYRYGRQPDLVPPGPGPTWHMSPGPVSGDARPTSGI